MIKPKLKICTGCKEPKHIWKSHGKEKLCQGCWNNIQQLKAIAKSTTKIAPVSKKKKEELSVYNKLREAFLLAKPHCEAKLIGCTGVSTDIHHSRGRIGDNLLKIGTWKALCRSCHTYVELNSKEAKELGLSESRLNKQQDEKNYN